MLINRWGVRSTPVEIDGDKAGSGRYVWTPDRPPEEIGSSIDSRNIVNEKRRRQAYLVEQPSVSNRSAEICSPDLMSMSPTDVICLVLALQHMIDFGDARPMSCSNTCIAG